MKPAETAMVNGRFEQTMRNGYRAGGKKGPCRGVGTTQSRPASHASLRDMDTYMVQDINRGPPSGARALRVAVQIPRATASRSNFAFASANNRLSNA